VRAAGFDVLESRRTRAGAVELVRARLTPAEDAPASAAQPPR
jgi:hypothetical protein